LKAEGGDFRFLIINLQGMRILKFEIYLYYFSNNNSFKPTLIGIFANQTGALVLRCSPVDFMVGWRGAWYEHSNVSKTTL